MTDDEAWELMRKFSRSNNLGWLTALAIRSGAFDEITDEATFASAKIIRRTKPQGVLQSPAKSSMG